MCDKKKGIHYDLENRQERVSAERDDVQVCEPGPLPEPPRPIFQLKITVLRARSYGSKRAPAMNPRPQNPDPFFSSKSQFLEKDICNCLWCSNTENSSKGTLEGKVPVPPRYGTSCPSGPVTCKAILHFANFGRRSTQIFQRNLTGHP